MQQSISIKPKPWNYYLQNLKAWCQNFFLQPVVILSDSANAALKQAGLKKAF